MMAVSYSLEVQFCDPASTEANIGHHSHDLPVVGTLHDPRPQSPFSFFARLVPGSSRAACTSVRILSRCPPEVPSSSSKPVSSKHRVLVAVSVSLKQRHR